mmetsp:Transcript_16628/g.34701  ORF Transcript_16628/g.34701 Transcript_16628/m.34701 type:complete len:122 (+) Transcript_16628:66-431(+)
MAVPLRGALQLAGLHSSACGRTLNKALPGPQLRRLAAGRPLRAPRFTDEQIEELSKYDAILAQQIKTARDSNLAVEWKDLDHMPLQEMPQWDSPMSRKNQAKEEGLLDMLKSKLLGTGKDK